MSFVFVSGRPSLDFAGTRKWREDEAPEEQLGTPDDLRAWLGAAAVVDPVPAVDGGALADAVELREAIYRAARDRVAGRPVRRADAARLAAAADAPPVRPVLAGGRRLRREGDVAAVLSTLARDAIEALGGPDAERLRRCANPRCTRLFVDSSRAGSRRWCGMTECGNAAKVAAFRARRADPPVVF